MICINFFLHNMANEEICLIILKCSKQIFDFASGFRFPCAQLQSLQMKVREVLWAGRWKEHDILSLSDENRSYFTAVSAAYSRHRWWRLDFGCRAALEAHSTRHHGEPTLATFQNEEIVRSPHPKSRRERAMQQVKKKTFLIFYFHGGGRVSSTQHDSLVRRETELNSTNKKKSI